MLAKTNETKHSLDTYSFSAVWLNGLTSYGPIQSCLNQAIQSMAMLQTKSTYIHQISRPYVLAPKDQRLFSRSISMPLTSQVIPHPYHATPISTSHPSTHPASSPPVTFSPSLITGTTSLDLKLLHTPPNPTTNATPVKATAKAHAPLKPTI